MYEPFSARDLHFVESYPRLKRMHKWAYPREIYRPFLSFSRYNLVMKKLFITFLFTLVFASTVLESVAENENVNWTRIFSDSLFEKAKKENKFVLLDLEAIWCHWCHVMHKETYSDPGVAKLINNYYIPARLDQDSRPDLSNRYRYYGWPATIVFNSKGEEIVKRAGYIRPEIMRELLQKIVNDPTPEDEDIDDSFIQFTSDRTLTKELKKILGKNHIESYDDLHGGLKLNQKFLDSDSVEYSLILEKQGNKTEEKRVRKTLDSAIKLIDPFWGGAYQYSTMGGWSYPHFEKLAHVQAKYLRIYSRAYLQFKDPDYLTAASDIYKYLKKFLTSKDGVFFTSQDADVIQGKHSLEYFSKSDIERRKLGIPRVDKNIYSNQNGLIIDSLVSFYTATGKKKYLDDAVRAADWIVRNRSLSFNFGENLKWLFSKWLEPREFFERIKRTLLNYSFPVQGYRHNEKDLAGPFLSDTLNMARGFVSLHLATKNKKWLLLAEKALRFIDLHFTTPVAGFSTSDVSCKVCAVRNPSRLTDENIEIARLTNKLYQITKHGFYKEMQEHSMRFLSTPEVAIHTLTEPGILIVDLEINKAII